MKTEKANGIKNLADMTLEELWRLFPIILTEHNAEWEVWYSDEESSLKKLLPCGTELDHIGSTAINGIWAKPIIDILAEVERDNDLKSVADVLVRNGYVIMSCEDKRISLNKGYTAHGFADRVFHLHLQYKSEKDEVLFRDHLNAHTEIAKEYEALKLRLWKQYEHDRDCYTAAKSEFVKKYTSVAKRERGQAE
ncbi:MAG: GrpB family protein [Clostridiales bacterium]|nr:GrpB family protein [Clostridiales bacterium]